MTVSVLRVCLLVKATYFSYVVVVLYIFFPQEPPFNSLCCELWAQKWIMIGKKHWLPAASGDFSSKPFNNSTSPTNSSTSPWIPNRTEEQPSAAHVCCGGPLQGGLVWRVVRYLGPPNANRGAPILFQYWSVPRFLDFSWHIQLEDLFLSHMQTLCKKLIFGLVIWNVHLMIPLAYCRDPSHWNLYREADQRSIPSVCTRHQFEPFHQPGSQQNHHASAW